MVEGGFKKPEKTEFTECWRTTWQTPYIMRLSFSAGFGGLLFGYDTGVISGALLYIKDDFPSVRNSTKMQEIIVSMAVAGAIFGAGIGGWLNDRIGRRKSILIADVLFFIGAIVMSTAPDPWVIILGRIIVGFGVGMASMTAPLYISEASPHRIRGALVSTNGLLITFGQFLSYLINLGFTKTPGTWRWMLGVAGIPPIVQFVLMWSLPESPRWLYRNGKTEESRAILERIYPMIEVEEEMQALKTSIEFEQEEECTLGNGGTFGKLKKAWASVVFRRGLCAGITVQVAQQFVGINTVMYYSPTIVQFAGFASNQVAMALSLVTSGLNAIGSIISMCFVDRYGRRRLMIISMFGIITCLIALSSVFWQAAIHAPDVSRVETTNFGGNSTTCLPYLTADDSSSWNCMKCLSTSPKCGFCSNKADTYSPGACLAGDDPIKYACKADGRVWYTNGCPSKFGFLAVILLGAYIVSYSPGMGTAPWIVNSEIYPLRFRGVGGGIAAMSNWVSNLIVSSTFLSLTEALGSSGTFLLFAGFSLLGLIAIFFLVPETKGLQFEEIENILQKGYRPACLKPKTKDEN